MFDANTLDSATVLVGPTSQLMEYFRIGGEFAVIGGVLGTLPAAAMNFILSGDGIRKIAVGTTWTACVAYSVGFGVQELSKAISLDASKPTVIHQEPLKVTDQLQQSVSMSSENQKPIPCTQTPDGKWMICVKPNGEFTTAQISPKPAASPAAAPAW